MNPNLHVLAYFPVHFPPSLSIPLFLHSYSPSPCPSNEQKKKKGGEREKRKRGGKKREGERITPLPDSSSATRKHQEQRKKTLQF